MIDRPVRIAVRLTGGLGDILIATPLVEQLNDAAGGAEITVHYHTPNVARFVFGNAGFAHHVKGHDEIVTRGPKAADLLVHAGHFPRYIIQNPRPFPDALFEAMATSRERIDSIAGFVKAHPKQDGTYARMVTRQGRSYLDGIGHLAGLPISHASEMFLAPRPEHQPDFLRLLKTGQRWITLHDGFDNRQAPNAGEATKCWPMRHWTELVRELRALLPDVFLVQIGAGKSRPIPGVNGQLVNQTTLDQAAWLIKGAALHIDTDSGLAHMARALHTTAVVLFGPTNVVYYGHREHENIANASVCADCWWTTPDWLSKCARGLAEPECMTTVAPGEVARVAVQRLELEDRIRRPVTASPVYLYDRMNAHHWKTKMCAALGLPDKPITEHISDPTSGLYVHASKQWEYAYALDAIHRLGDVWGMRVADVGGGRGALAAFLSKCGAQVHQYDLDYRWAGDVSTERHYRLWAKRNGYRASFGSIYNVPAPSLFFDVVTCISVVEHLPEKASALRELVRLVKPGGMVVLTFDFTLTPDRFRDKMRVDIFSPSGLVAQLDQLGLIGPEMLMPSPEAIDRSAALIQSDGVAGIPAGMTVAGLTLFKANT